MANWPLTPPLKINRTHVPVIKEVKSVAAERVPDVVDELGQKSAGAKRREFYGVVVLEVAFFLQRPYPPPYFADEFGGFSDTLVGHSIGEQQDIVVKTPATKLHYRSLSYNVHNYKLFGVVLKQRNR